MPFLLSYGSHDTRRVDFRWVDGLSMDTPGLGRHTHPCLFRATIDLLG